MRRQTLERHMCFRGVSTIISIIFFIAGENIIITKGAKWIQEKMLLSFQEFNKMYHEYKIN